MNTIEPRIIELPDMRVISFHGFGEEPELLAWQKCFQWMEEQGMLKEIDQHRFFGYNNPDPSPGSPNYGYEILVTVDQDVDDTGEGTQKILRNGRYAVYRSENLLEITNDWQKLNAWLETSPYFYGNHQWLEECHTVNLILESMQGEFDPTKQVHDLYIPIQK